ncbi:MAG: FAD-binding protein [Ruminococcus sp.]|jgi:L-aspartate oxidase|nr:FAD-binding protein [Ruminococcus sp.]
MKTDYDVIIVGAGVAGLYAALNTDENRSVLIISKSDLEVCNSVLAQGGIAAVYESPDDDNFDLHFNDSMRAGGFKNDPMTLRKLVTEAPTDIERILYFGVHFDKDSEGAFHRTLEGGHSRRRIFHYKDSSGNEMTKKLRERVLSRPNITVLPNAMMTDLKKTGTGFSVDVLTGSIHLTLNSSFLIIATGGIGRVYEKTTNSAIATGDGIMCAYELGAAIKNLSLIQFHPTAFSEAGSRQCFLISESVRGEGAFLVNKDNRRFMADYDPERMELAPRDVVSHSIIKESRKLGSNEFYLDITHKPKIFLTEHFPGIYDFLLTKGIDMSTDKIPVFPCHHYLMGGINVDITGQTSIDGLYACGECAHTGVHGNNRLASNSLLEALVFGRLAAEDISRRLNELPPVKSLETARFEHDERAQSVPEGIRRRIRNIIQKAYFVVPDMEEAVNGITEIENIKEMLANKNFKKDEHFTESKALSTVAFLILQEII